MSIGDLFSVFDAAKKERKLWRKMKLRGVEKDFDTSEIKKIHDSSVGRENNANTSLPTKL